MNSLHKPWRTPWLTISAISIVCLLVDCDPVECTLEICNDRMKLVVFQDTDTPTEDGLYKVIVSANAITPRVLDITVGDGSATLPDDQLQEAMNLGSGPVPLGINASGHLEIEIAHYFADTESPAYSLELEQLSVEVSSGSLLLGSETVYPDYENYWCTSPECDDRKNYHAEAEIQVDFPPVLE